LGLLVPGCWAGLLGRAGIEAHLGPVARTGMVPGGLRALPVAVEAPLLVLLAFAGSAGFWWLARSTGPLRPWLGLPRRPYLPAGTLPSTPLT
jgi:hypothetical protein